LGASGREVLARVALDPTAATGARVAAVRSLAPTDGTPVFASLLKDPLPVLRFWALERLCEAGASQYVDEVSSLLGDPATFHDLDEEISIAETARRVLTALRG